MSEPRLADRSARVLSAGVDSLLAWSGGLVGASSGAIVAAATGHLDDSAGFVYAALFGGVAVVLTGQWWLLARTGQTVGKRWLAIRIERLDGTLPGFLVGVVVRQWVSALAGMMCGVLKLADLVYVFRPDRRAVHDWLAGTRVVRTDDLP